MDIDLAPGPYRFRFWRTLRLAVVVTLGFLLLNFALSAGNPAWLTAAGWWRAASMTFLFSTAIAFTIHGLFLAGGRLFGARLQTTAPWKRNLFYWGTPVLGVVIATTVVSLLTGAGDVAGDEPRLRTTPLGAVAFMVLVMALFYGYFAIRHRQLRAEQRATEAQLKLLQGQIEPHFLFNTLANVLGLMEADTPRAKLMLESFVDYLRSSLGGLRHANHTLGDELDLVDAYLRVIKIRMEDRLLYTIDVPDALRSRPLPALTLQPLVENAVLHGLEPTIAGGSIAIDARIDDHMLVVSVVDNGLGAVAAAASGRRGSGTALANTRERLLQAYGERGQLQIERNLPQGVRATLRIPAP